MHIASEFTLRMIQDDAVHLEIQRVTRAHARKVCRHAASAVGDAALARVFSRELDRMVPAEPRVLKLVVGEQLLVGQYRGPPIPHAATELPDGAKIEWMIVTVNG